MNNQLVFDEEKHAYYLGGVKLPSVTQVMKPLYDFSMVNPDVLRRAGEFGTAVHKTVELYLENDLDESSLDENLVKPLEAFKRWMDDHPHILYPWRCIEKRMAHKKHKFAGTADLITETVIIDIKTRPACVYTDSVQIAAYEMLWTHENGSGKYDHRVLELKQDGTYEYVTVKRPGTRERFRYLLDYHKMTTQIELWRKQK